MSAPVTPTERHVDPENWEEDTPGAYWHDSDKYVFITPPMMLTELDALFNTMAIESCVELFAAQDEQDQWHGFVKFSRRRNDRRLNAVPFRNSFSWEHWGASSESAWEFCSSFGDIQFWL
jgi:hypothetical protein